MRAIRVMGLILARNEVTNTNIGTVYSTKGDIRDTTARAYTPGNTVAASSGIKGGIGPGVLGE